MVFLSILGGVASVVLGLFSSLEFNTASGPTIIVVALVLFILSMLAPNLDSKLKK